MVHLFPAPPPTAAAEHTEILVRLKSGIPILRIGEPIGVRSSAYHVIHGLSDRLPAATFSENQGLESNMATLASAPDVMDASGGASIVDRGRGPEIVGTRITIYDIMDFLKCNCDVDDIATSLWIERDQVVAAISYIRSRQEQSDREYALILERLSRPNPREVERGRAKTREELRRRIGARVETDGAHDNTGGQ